MGLTVVITNGCQAARLLLWIGLVFSKRRSIYEETSHFFSGGGINAACY